MMALLEERIIYLVLVVEFNRNCIKLMSNTQEKKTKFYATIKSVVVVTWKKYTLSKNWAMGKGNGTEKFGLPTLILFIYP